MRCVPRKFALALVIVLFCANNSFGSSCNNPVLERIQFAKGAMCWYYAGKATHFIGTFSRGQRVTVEMNGEAWVAAETGNLSKPIWTARAPVIEGPHNFLASSDIIEQTGSLKVTLPETGKYTFGFYPCGMWGGYGHVAICASKPN